MNVLISFILLIFCGYIQTRSTYDYNRYKYLKDNDNYMEVSGVRFKKTVRSEDDVMVCANGYASN